MAEHASEHPWLVPPSDPGDETEGTGDPRDMVVPTVRRGGMTVVDETAWKAAINAVANEDAPCPTGARVGVLRSADRLGLCMEDEILAGADVGETFVNYTDCVDNDEVARVLRDHWTYGPRFWAWWQGRQRPAPRSLSECAGAIAERHADPTAAHLAPGDQIRTHTGWHTVVEAAHPAYPHVATESGHWFRGAILETRTRGEWSAPETKPAPATNAHGVDVSKIREGDYFRADTGRSWCRMIGATAGRPAPRITLPDGREVAVSRSYRPRRPGADRLSFADGKWWHVEPDALTEVAVPDGELSAYWDRVWPPLDVEPERTA